MDAITITVPIDSELARLYTSLSEQDKRKLQVMLTIWLREIEEGDPETLERIMQRISRNAQARGLTPEILEALLADDH